MEKEIKIGDKFRRPMDYGHIVIMAFKDRYFMVRRPRCMPFILNEKELKKDWRAF